MRVRWFILALVSCGRLGFDTGDRFDPTADARPTGSVCTLDLQCGRCARCDGTCQPDSIVDVAPGHRSTCYLGTGGSRWCVGDNGGELGLGDVEPRTLAARIVGEDGWTALFGGYQEGFGIRQGQLWRWGGNQLVPAPVPTQGATSVRSVSVEAYRSCVVFSDGTAACDPSGSQWRSLDVAEGFQCGVKTDRSLWCWGTNAAGNLGQGVLEMGVELSDPTQVGTAADWDVVGAGRAFACALKIDGTLWCWGDPMKTATSGVDTMGVPVQVGTDNDWTKLLVDWERACGMRGTDTAWCWGADTYGAEIVPGLLTVPVPMLLADKIDDLVIGGHHACVHGSDLARLQTSLMCAPGRTPTPPSRTS